jgi:hypothetical protein
MLESAICKNALSCGRVYRYFYPLLPPQNGPTPKDDAPEDQSIQNLYFKVDASQYVFPSFCAQNMTTQKHRISPKYPA